MKKILILLSLFAIVSCSGGETKEINNNESTQEKVTHTGGEQQYDKEEGMMNDDASVKQILSDSPRHQEWVEIDNNGKTIHAFVVYPENKETSSAVVMIHENKGLNDWARSMADQLAAEGHIVIAPDLLSSFDEERQKTSDFSTPDDATQALYSLDQEDISSDLQAVADYVEGIQTFNGNLVSAGFCWGGSQSFLLADQADDYKASLVFYGTAPEEESFYENVSVPVYGFYAENDDRVNSTIENTQTQMEKNVNTFEYQYYEGVGHAFMRKADTDPSDMISNKAKNEAFERMKSILEQYK